MTSGSDDVSERFCASDSDIVLRSTDDVRFKVHRINLKMHSDIFADAEDISSSGACSTVSLPSKSDLEVVQLSESSAVLELLLQYTYRQPPPDLSLVEFELLADLAEAAEKYRIYFAIDATKRAMREAIPKHPFVILNWAVKHKHTIIIDEAAERTIGLTPENVREDLSPRIQTAWIEYQRHWMDALNAEYARHSPTTTHWNNSTRESDIPCEPWTHSYALITHRLAAKPEMLLKLQEVFGPSEDYLRSHCGECSQTIVSWRTSIQRAVEKIPKFSTLL